MLVVQDTICTWLTGNHVFRGARQFLSVSESNNNNNNNNSFAVVVFFGGGRCYDRQKLSCTSSYARKFHSKLWGTSREEPVPFRETFPAYPGLGFVLWPLLGHMVPTLRGGHLSSTQWWAYQSHPLSDAVILIQLLLARKMESFSSSKWKCYNHKNASKFHQIEFVLTFLVDLAFCGSFQLQTFLPHFWGSPSSQLLAGGFVEPGPWH